MGRTSKVVPGRVPFTWRKLVTAGVLAAACAPAVAAYALQSGEPDRIEWSISTNGSHMDSGKVQLTIESRWGANSQSVWSNDRPISDLQGLNPAQLNGSGGPVRFALIRDAGRLDCSGSAGHWRGPIGPAPRRARV